MLSVYKASAGSGKTFTLTREYIKMLLGVKNTSTNKWSINRGGHNRHRSILAITFTNKATDEMKRRIVHELAVLAGMEPGWTKPSKYTDMLTAELNCSAAELSNAAAIALRELLHDFTCFHVSTIDSFFQTVLRTFAREAELLGNYEVELDSKNVLKIAVGDLLATLRNEDNPKANRQLEGWLLRKLMSKLREGKAFNLFNRSSELFSNLVEFLNSISNETFQEHRSEIFRFLDDDKRITRFIAEVENQIKSLKDNLAQAGLRLNNYISSLGYTPKDILQYNTANLVVKYADGIPAKIESTAATPAKMAALNPGIYKTEGKEKRPVYIDYTLNALLADLGNLIVNFQPQYSLYSNILANTLDIGLLRRIDDIMQANLSADNSLLLSDTASILKSIIGDNPAPFVFERIGAMLHHFLIDEFQDTSVLQWSVLKLLVGEGLSNGHDSLIIGDEKQCIYRFRNSDPSLLREGVACDFAQHVAVSGDSADENTNWRSSADVVEFNNALFAGIARTIGFDDIYANVVQNVSKPHLSHQGYVKVQSFSCGKQDPYAPKALKFMMDEITRQIDSGYKPSQIVVLVRFNTEGQQVMDYIMNAHRTNPDWPALRVVSDDSFAIGNSAVVRMVVSILRVMAADVGEHNPRRITHRHYSRLIEAVETRVNDGMTRTEALAAVLEAESIGAFRDENVEKDEFLLDRTAGNLTTWVGYIISHLVAPDVVAAENAFISAFSDMVNDYQQRVNSDLRAFIKWWDTTGCKSKVNLPPDDDAIRVVTIHKAKGLEYPCVHIPFTNWDTYKFKSPEWFEMSGLPGINPELTPDYLPIVPADYMCDTFLKHKYESLRNNAVLDEFNVLYVALTRAVDELIIGISADKPDANTVSALIANQLNLEADCCFTAGEPTMPQAETARENTALEPTALEDMPHYYAYDRSDLFDSTGLDKEDVTDRQRRGISIHAVMAALRTPDDLHRVCRKFVRAGSISEADATQLEATVERMINSETVRRWFFGNTKALNECELCLADGSILRPDRMVWLPDGSVEVVDYKTGAEKPRAHSDQVIRYLSALRKIGYTNVRGYLWYLDSGRIVTV